MKRISRRQFLLTLAGAGLATGGYAKWIEPSWLDISHQKIPLFDQPAEVSLHVLHLSDLHASPAVSLQYIESAINQGLQLKPDLVCLTGDFITHILDEATKYRAILEKITSVAPTFACLGNHDGGLWAAARNSYRSPVKVVNLLESAGVEVLLNRSTLFDFGNRKVWLVGIGDLWSGNCFPQKAFETIPESNNHPVIVLAHNPDSKDQLRKYPWQLMLSGHTHGGQIRFPLIGAPFAPVKDQRFIAGYYAWEKRHLYISRGVGNVYGIRFNCRPEISLLKLV